MAHCLHRYLPQVEISGPNMFPSTQTLCYQQNTQFDCSEHIPQSPAAAAHTSEGGGGPLEVTDGLIVAAWETT